MHVHLLNEPITVLVTDTPQLLPASVRRYVNLADINLVKLTTNIESLRAHPLKNPLDDQAVARLVYWDEETMSWMQTGVEIPICTTDVSSGRWIVAEEHLLKELIVGVEVQAGPGTEGEVAFALLDLIAAPRESLSGILAAIEEMGQTLGNILNGNSEC